MKAKVLTLPASPEEMAEIQKKAEQSFKQVERQFRKTHGVPMNAKYEAGVGLTAPVKKKKGG